MSPPTFTPFETIYEQARKLGTVSKSCDASEFYGKAIRTLQSRLGRLNRGETLALQNAAAEWNWVYDRRPFYRVWPSVIEGFRRTRLDIPISCVSIPHPVLSIEMPSATGLRSALTFVSEGRADGSSGGNTLVILTQDERGKREECHLGILFESKKTIEEELEHASKNTDGLTTDLDESNQMLALRMVVCVSLIAKDPRFVESICLAKDRHRRTCENADELQSKAAKRGVLGWDVGRSVDVGPHVRRPHFAIRWCGTKQEGLEPRLVPIKGALVKGRKITDVPTGWHGGFEPADD